VLCRPIPIRLVGSSDSPARPDPAVRLAPRDIRRYAALLGDQVPYYDCTGRACEAWNAANFTQLMRLMHWRPAGRDLGGWLEHS
jgi:hypothetical protein